MVPQPDSFVSLVETHLPHGMDYFAVQQGLREASALGRDQPRNVADCIQRIGELNRDRRGNERLTSDRDADEDRKARVVTGRPTDRTQGRRRAVLLRVEPLIRLIRQRVFNCDTAPFRTLDEAVEWIRAQVPTPEEVSTDYKVSYAAWCEIGETIYRTSNQFRCHELRGHTHAARGLECWRPLFSVMVARDTPLDTLRSGCRDVVFRNTGLSERAILAYIMVGIVDDSPPWSAKIPYSPRHGIGVNSPAITITIDPDAVNVRTFQRIASDIRKRLGHTRQPRAFSPPDLELLSVVAKFGGPPARFDRPYWTRVCQTFRAKGKKRKPRFSDPKIAARAYARLIRRQAGLKG